MSATDRIAVVGAGLGGALVATLLAESGRPVDLYEKRADPRSSGAGGGRSINLALSARGMHALGCAGLADAVRAMAVPMRGRMLHARTGRRTFLPYGTAADQVLHSVSRDGLNRALLDRAERTGRVRLHFGRKCAGLDPDAGRLTFAAAGERDAEPVEAAAVIGADGAFSAVRRRLSRIDRFDYQQSYLSHGYKELTIPPAAGGGFALDNDALHIWPRGGFMMIALPNHDGSFTCTLFWPLDRTGQLTGLDSEAAVTAMFAREFPDAVPHLPDLAGQFAANPTGSLVTIRCRPWHHGGRVVLLGDACHAVVPFFGQGANAAFEDAVVLTECLDRQSDDRPAAFAEYEARRRVHTDTLADLSLSNFREMRDRTRSFGYRMRRTVERGLHRIWPRAFVPLYTLVAFTRVPYRDAVRRVRRQERLLVGIAATGFLVISLLLLVFL